MDRPPFPKKATIISRIMWRNILGHSIYQLIVLAIVLYAFAQPGQDKHLKGGWINIYSGIPPTDKDTLTCHNLEKFDHDVEEGNVELSETCDLEWQSFCYPHTVSEREVALNGGTTTFDDILIGSAIPFGDYLYYPTIDPCSELTALYGEDSEFDVNECCVCQDAYDNPTRGFARKAELWQSGIRPTKRECSAHFGIIFNGFVLMQLFNQINARKIKGEFNAFAGIFNNLYFIYITIFEFAVQVILVISPAQIMVHLSGGLSPTHWGICVLFGLGSLPVHCLVAMAPETVIPEFFLKFESTKNDDDDEDEDKDSDSDGKESSKNKDAVKGESNGSEPKYSP